MCGVAQHARTERVAGELEDDGLRMIRSCEPAHSGKPVTRRSAAICEVRDSRLPPSLDQKVDVGLGLNSERIAEEADADRAGGGRGGLREKADGQY